MSEREKHGEIFKTTALPNLLFSSIFDNYSYQKTIFVIANSGVTAKLITCYYLRFSILK